ncbi:hypothetical protein BV898_05818 [Hypsibius exemplaris]|uniref:Uncharacterized protein n=1 Tax=Hypsibius exemplaris TaxID=2072580 RepID=A0A1W0WYJ5_HYPEX|nr:hypothetical protein BV898_05818 [Hypsibius exemplaris]
MLTSNRRGSRVANEAVTMFSLGGPIRQCRNGSARAQDITRRCGSGGLPIHYAARFGSLDVLRFFLQTPKLRVDEMLRSVDDEEATPAASGLRAVDTVAHCLCLRASDIVGMIHDFNVLNSGESFGSGTHRE